MIHFCGAQPASKALTEASYASCALLKRYGATGCVGVILGRGLTGLVKARNVTKEIEYTAAMRRPA